MGNQTSTSQTISETVNKALNDIVMSSSSKCEIGTDISALQSFDFSNSKVQKGCSLNFSNIKQNVTNDTKLTCVNKDTLQNNIESQFKTTLEQLAKSQVSGVAGAVNSAALSENVSKLANDIVTKVDINDLSTCITNNTMKGTLIFKDIPVSCPAYCENPKMCTVSMYKNKICDMDKCSINYKDISQNIVNTSINDCTSNNETINKIISDAANEIKQTSSSENTGINIGGIFAIVLIIVAIGAGIYFTMNKGVSALASKEGIILISVVLVIIIGSSIYFFMSKDEENEEDE
jgi:hypothetical protein